MIKNNARTVRRSTDWNGPTVGMWCCFCTLASQGIERLLGRAQSSGAILRCLAQFPDLPGGLIRFSTMRCGKLIQLPSGVVVTRTA